MCVLVCERVYVCWWVCICVFVSVCVCVCVWGAYVTRYVGYSALQLWGYSAVDVGVGWCGCGCVGVFFVFFRRCIPFRVLQFYPIEYKKKETSTAVIEMSISIEQKKNMRSH